MRSWFVLLNAMSLVLRSVAGTSLMKGKYCLNEWIKWSASHLWNILSVEFPHKSFSAPSHCSSFLSKGLRNDSIPHPKYVPLLSYVVLRQVPSAAFSAFSPHQAHHPHFFLLLHIFMSWGGPSPYLSLTSKHIPVLLISHLQVWLQTEAQLLSFASNRWTESSLLHELLMDTLSSPHLRLQRLSAWDRGAKICTCIHTHPHMPPHQRHTK